VAPRVGVEGRLLVRVAWDGHMARKVEIASSRPVQACRVFHDKPVAQALDLLPLLYTVCRTAQNVAAVAACQQACGVTVDASVRRLRQRLVLAEIAQEYLWRFLLDWPQITGQPMDARAYAALRKKLGGLLQPMLADAAWSTLREGASARNETWDAYCTALADDAEREIFGMPARTWNDFDSIDALQAWSRRAPTAMARVVAMLLREDAQRREGNAIALMPPARELAQASELLAADAEFARHPHWRGRPLETGALARMQDHPLVRAVLGQGRRILARVVARLLELAALPRRIRDASGACVALEARVPGVGLAWVETARGLLLHRVEVTGEQVSRYQILAPTEWNFHPQGALAQALSGMRADTEPALRGKIAQAMLSLDPCVGYELTVAPHA
jgi:coenzyme F420-reducing hydrogenase alpha subunit